jgi:threonine dehydrogenase-like Zn-dependent dehydrogenase
MRVVLADDGLQVTEMPDPGLLEGGLRIRVLVSAITGLDVDVAAGRRAYHGVPGTSFVGIVEEARGPEGRGLVGRRVVGRPVHGCGVCDACQTGDDHRCRDRVRPGLYGAPGSHAEYIHLPVRAVVPVPDGVSDEAAALAAPAAAVLDALARGDLPRWTNVLVVGDGGMGMLSAVSLASAGYTVTLRGKHGDRFDLLRRHGIHFNLATDEDEISGMRPGRFGPALASYPFVFEVTGQASGWDAATRLVSPGGSLYVLSSFQDGVPRSLTEVLEKNVRVLGLRQGPLEPVLRILAGRLFDPTEVVSRVYPLDKAPEAYQRTLERRDRMALIRVSYAD